MMAASFLWSRRLRGWRCCIVVIVVATMALAGRSMAQSPPPVEFPISTLTIESGGARHSFVIEVATTPAQHARGLMYRQALQPDHGMLFVYPKADYVMMWMKNTYIPLDMVFVDDSGKIAGIAADTMPLSTDIIPSPGAVKAVIEFAAGTAQRLGIHEGDRVNYPEVAGSKDSK